MKIWMNKPKTENKAMYDSDFSIQILCRAWHRLVLREISPIPLWYRSHLVQLEFKQIKLTTEMAIEEFVCVCATPLSSNRLLHTQEDLMFHTEEKNYTPDFVTNHH